MAIDLLKYMIWKNGTGGGASYEKTVGPAPIISISDAKAKPAKSLVVGIEPIQDLHGYDSPWPAGGGKNLLNPAFDWTKSSGSGVNIDSSADGTITLSGNAEELNVFDSTRSIPSGTYTFSCFNNSAESKVQIYLIDSQGAVTGNFGLNVANKTATFTSANELTKLRIRALAGFSGTFTFKPMMVSGDTAPASWIPYSNLCPISGRTEANIYRYAEYDADAQPTYTIQLGQTVYGGTVDLVTGVLTVDCLPLVFDNTAWTFSSTFFYRFFDDLKNVVVSGYYMTENGVKMHLNGNNGQARIYLSDNPFIASDTDVGSLLNGYKLIYELKTPQTYQLTPTQIQLLKNENVLWSDANSLTLTYLAKKETQSLGNSAPLLFGDLNLGNALNDTNQETPQETVVDSVDGDINEEE